MHAENAVVIPTGKRTIKPAGPKITKENMILALAGSCGIVKRIARKLDVTVGAAKGFINKHEDMKELFRDEQDNFVDHAEDAVKRSMDQIADPRTVLAAAKYVLQTKGKDRGWRKEITVQGGLNINHTAVVDLTKLNLPLEMQRMILDQIEASDTKTIDVKATPAPLLPAPKDIIPPVDGVALRVPLPAPKVKIAIRPKVRILKRAV